jgi:hypothetical protein
MELTLKVGKSRLRGFGLRSLGNIMNDHASNGEPGEVRSADLLLFGGFIHYYPA